MQLFSAIIFCNNLYSFLWLHFARKTGILNILSLDNYKCSLYISFWAWYIVLLHNIPNNKLLRISPLFLTIERHKFIIYNIFLSKMHWFSNSAEIKWYSVQFILFQLRMVYREGWIGKNVFAILKAQISIIILSKKLLKIK